jgi:MtrB/PioB family decaheme-associated outer membrane protein
MKTTTDKFAVNTMTLAVHAAMLAMFVMPTVGFAADDEVAELIRPTNRIEVGAISTSDSSGKFGEYNGLTKSGVDLNVNFELYGGDTQDENPGLTRWELKGNDLGTTSRELSGNISKQGQWSIGFNYDELRHTISDTYQTPYIGDLGGNVFTLPSAFGAINTSASSGSFINGVEKRGAQNMTATQKSLFKTTDVHSDRKNTSLTAGYEIDRRLSINFDYNHLDQSGAKLIVAASDRSVNWGAEGMVTLMNPTNYTTDTFNVGLNWKGEKSYVTASLFSSFFRDQYNGVSFQSPFNTTLATGAAGASPMWTLSTAPDNDFYQLNLGGGYTISPTTKLSGNVSLGRNTQNEAYINTAMMQTNGLPRSSLDALVVSTHADLKLTNQASKNLLLTAGMKYNERDNQTASYLYKYIDITGVNRDAVNIPMSNRKTQFELSGDYRLDQNRRIHVGYEREQINRWCNNALANSQQSQTPLAGYVSASCVQVPENKEDKITLGYKAKASDAVDYSVGYSFADRTADIVNFYNPIQARPAGYEKYGFRAYFDAARKEQALKAGVNWQANDKLSLSLNGRYVDQKYDDSPLGVQKGNSWSANIDATYNYSDNGSVSAYASSQKSHRDLTNGGNNGNALTLATNLFSNRLNDSDNTIGVSVKQTGLMKGKLELKGDVSYSNGTTGYSTQVPYLSTCSATTTLTCGTTPDIKSELIQLKVTGIYKVDKASKVAIGYLYQKETSSDYLYNFFQTGYTSTGALPTNEQAASYSVNVITVSYIYSF